MRKRWKWFLVGLISLVWAAAASAGVVNVDIYSGHSTTGGGTPYTNLVESFTSPDIMFGTNTGFDWHPADLDSFGADITGCLDVAVDGNYQFKLNSDDGSLLFIDGNLVVNNGGGHAPQVRTGNIWLDAGTYPFEVQFFEDFGGTSGVDLTLPRCVTYGTCPTPPVPVPGALLLAVLGSAGVGMLRRRRSL